MMQWINIQGEGKGEEYDNFSNILGDITSNYGRLFIK